MGKDGKTYGVNLTACISLQLKRRLLDLTPYAVLRYIRGIGRHDGGEDVAGYGEGVGHDREVGRHVGFFGEDAAQRILVIIRVAVVEVAWPKILSVVRTKGACQQRRICFVLPRLLS